MKDNDRNLSSTILLLAEIKLPLHIYAVSPAEYDTLHLLLLYVNFTRG